MTTQQLLQLLRFHRNLEHQSQRSRVRKAKRRGQVLVTQLEMETTLKTISRQITALEKSFKRIAMLQRMEETILGKEDKRAGRNRLELRYGKE